MSYKATTNQHFEDIDQFLLDGISDNMVSLVQSGNYCYINTTDTSKMRSYVIKFVSEAYGLQYDTKCDKQMVSAGGHSI